MLINSYMFCRSDPENVFIRYEYVYIALAESSWPLVHVHLAHAHLPFVSVLFADRPWHWLLLSVSPIISLTILLPPVLTNTNQKYWPWYVQMWTVTCRRQTQGLWRHRFRCCNRPTSPKLKPVWLNTYTWSWAGLGSTTLWGGKGDHLSWN